MATILIIEDDDNVRDTLVDLVRSAGYETIAPSSSDKVIAAIRGEAYDLAITDVIMPNLDGIEAMKLVRTNRPNCPILTISGGARSTSPEMMLHMTKMLGADETLKKPFSKAQLLAAITSLLRNAPA